MGPTITNNAPRPLRLPPTFEAPAEVATFVSRRVSGTRIGPGAQRERPQRSRRRLAVMGHCARWLPLLLLSSGSGKASAEECKDENPECRAWSQMGE